MLVEMKIEILDGQRLCLFSNEPFEKRPVMTIKGFVLHSNDHFESHRVRLLGESCGPKKSGATWEKNCTKIEKSLASERWEHTDSWLEAQIGASPRTKYKRSKNVFSVTSIALTLAHLGTELLQPVPWKTRLEMLNYVVIEILNDGEILVN